MTHANGIRLRLTIQRKGGRTVSALAAAAATRRSLDVALMGKIAELTDEQHCQWEWHSEHVIQNARRALGERTSSIHLTKLETSAK
jgi:hypothetical protein